MLVVDEKRFFNGVVPVKVLSTNAVYQGSCAYFPVEALSALWFKNEWVEKGKVFFCPAGKLWSKRRIQRTRYGRKGKVLLALEAAGY